MISMGQQTGQHRKESLKSADIAGFFNYNTLQYGLKAARRAPQFSKS